LINPVAARLVPCATGCRASDRMRTPATAWSSAAPSARWKPTLSPWIASRTCRTRRPSRGLAERSTTSSPGRSRRMADIDRPRGASGKTHRAGGGDASSGSKSGEVRSPRSSRTTPPSSAARMARKSGLPQVGRARGRTSGGRATYVPDPRTHRTRPNLCRSR